jgi:hypothetical protein
MSVFRQGVRNLGKNVMADPENEGIQDPGSGSPEANKQPKPVRGTEAEEKNEKDKASEQPEWQDPEFEPSDISREQQASSICRAG